jgi:hypothetical protein
MRTAKDFPHLDVEKTSLDVEPEFVLPEKGKHTGREDELKKFAKWLKWLQRKRGMRWSARGVAYLLEQAGKITKNEFDWAEQLVLECIDRTYLPVDFVKQDPGRVALGVQEPNWDETPTEYFRRQLRFTVKEGGGYIPDYWRDEIYYIQIIVEKVDLITLFRPDDDDIIRAAEAGVYLEPICQNYHIPIANAKGWSSVLQRATFARRFKDAEERGLQAVLLLFGDLDPDGYRITDNYHKNFNDIKDIEWSNGETGYDPSDLIIERVGLNKDFIDRYDIPSIDNLQTAGTKEVNGKKVPLDLSDPTHRNHNLPYVQNYLRDYGVHKWEAQAFVGYPLQTQELLRRAIDRYYGLNAKNRFKQKEQDVIDKISEYIRRSRAEKSIERLLEEE